MRSAANQQSWSSGKTARAATRIIKFESGLFAVEVGALSLAVPANGDASFPQIRLWQRTTDEQSRLTLLRSGGSNNSWIGAGGDVVVVEVPIGGGELMITSFAAWGEEPESPTVRVHALNNINAASRWAALAAEERLLAHQENPRVSEEILTTSTLEAPSLHVHEVPLEILAHIERVGDQLFSGVDWAGTRGQRRRLEGFSIRPVEQISLPPLDVHYKAFHSGGVESAWIGGLQFCGSRGRSLPLIGFAVRVAPHLQARFSVEYQGAFFSGGISDTVHNGEPCLSRAPDDPLEAMKVRLSENELE